MAAQIMMPNKQEETSIGRRLIAMAAPIVGGIYGGPAGAAAGGALGTKVRGGTGQDALAGGAQAGIDKYLSDKAEKDKKEQEANSESAQTPDLSEKLQRSEFGESAFARRSAAKSQDPQIAIQDGLNALPHLSPELRQQYTAPLVRAQ